MLPLLYSLPLKMVPPTCPIRMPHKNGKHIKFLPQHYCLQNSTSEIITVSVSFSVNSLPYLNVLLDFWNWLLIDLPTTNLSSPPHSHSVSSVLWDTLFIIAQQVILKIRVQTAYVVLKMPYWFYLAIALSHIPSLNLWMVSCLITFTAYLNLSTLKNDVGIMRSFS